MGGGNPVAMHGMVTVVPARARTSGKVEDVVKTGETTNGGKCFAYIIIAVYIGLQLSSYSSIYSSIYRPAVKLL